MLFSRLAAVAASVASIIPIASAQITLPSSPSKQDYMNAAEIAKENMLTFYSSTIPGYMQRPDVYYWFQAGGMLGQLIQHWNLTGNDSLNDMITTGLVYQIGQYKNFEPSNQSKDLGNDDQLFWAWSVMDAAEYNFPAPPADSGVSWLGLAQAVFNRQIGRWDTQYCNGGVRWQIFPYNNGFNYKNFIVNGGLLQLSARLARFTGNDTYAMWAEKLWDWSSSEGLIAPGNDSQTALHLYDGFGIDNNCKPVNTVQFTYNFGTALMGAAFMYNYTNGNETWKGRVEGLMEGLYDHIYLVQSIGENPSNAYPDLSKPGNILTESADEFQTPQNSDNDDPAFKGLTIRWLAVSSQLAPFIAANVTQILADSAQGAAKQCSGSSPNSGGSTTPPGSSLAAANTPNNWCGRRWYQTKWDTYNGYGEQMSAMSVFQNNLITMQGGNVPAPLTQNTGGTSVSQPSAGTAQGQDNPANSDPALSTPIGTADKAGAAIMTILGIVIVAFGLWFMVTGD